MVKAKYSVCVCVCVCVCVRVCACLSWWFSLERIALAVMPFKAAIIITHDVSEMLANNHKQTTHSWKLYP